MHDVVKQNVIRPVDSLQEEGVVLSRYTIAKEWNDAQALETTASATNRDSHRTCLPKIATHFISLAILTECARTVGTAAVPKLMSLRDEVNGISSSESPPPRAVPAGVTFATGADIMSRAREEVGSSVGGAELGEGSSRRTTRVLPTCESPSIRA